MGNAGGVAGVVVPGDVLRPDTAGRPGGTDRPTRWLADAVARTVARAGGGG